MKDRRKELATLFFTIFLDMLGVGILIPVIPMLFAEPTSVHYLLSPLTSERTGYLLLGTLLSLFSIGQFIAAPIIGQFSDKFGRKYLLAYGVFGTAFGHALFAFALLVGNIPLLFIARFLSGLAGGNIVVAQAAIADITPLADRAKNFGMIGAAFGLGFIFGPFLGGVLADSERVSWFAASTPFWFAALLSFLNGLFVIFFLRETHPSPRREQVIEWHRSLQNIARATRLTSLRSLLLTNLFFSGWVCFLHDILRTFLAFAIRTLGGADRKLFCFRWSLDRLYSGVRDAGGGGAIFRIARVALFACSGRCCPPPFPCCSEYVISLCCRAVLLGGDRIDAGEYRRGDLSIRFG